MLAALLGISPSQEAEIKAFMKNGGAQAFAEQIKCASENLAALRQLSEREYGMPVKPENAISFSVNKRPSMPMIVVNGSNEEEVLLVQELGKSVTRGHVKCQFDSDEPALLYFGIKNEGTGLIVYGNDFYGLEPSGVLDFSWEFDSIKIKSDAGGSTKVQIFAQ
jgi:hypothetical protein